MKEELDQSKPYVPLLERSSQLMEESILSEAVKLEIDATPLPLRKKARKLRAKAEKAAKKRSIEEVDKENEQQEVGERNVSSSWKNYYYCCAISIILWPTKSNNNYGEPMHQSNQRKQIHSCFMMWNTLLSCSAEL